MKLSKEAAKAISALNSAGFEAYAVGGCVRDSLLLKAPHDWDIATIARPGQIKACFAGEKTLDTGIRHGTVTVIFGGRPVEITSYRIDGSYSDGRRPDSVAFTDSLKADLSRRDFTVNALAYHPEHGIMDYFNGRQDLKNGVIRCVGNAETRFFEDALRILRAVRFSSVLGFAIEPETQAAMEKLAPRLKKISAERVFSELARTLTGTGAAAALSRNRSVLLEIIPEIARSVGFRQHSKYHDLDVFAHTVKALENSPEHLMVRLAILFHDIGKPDTFAMHEDGSGHFYGHASKSAEIAEHALNRLRCDNVTKNRVVYLVKHHHDALRPERAAIKRALNKMGEEALRQLLAVKRADCSATRAPYAQSGQKALDAAGDVLAAILAEGEAFSLDRLGVNGSDLLSIGFTPGKQVGKTLHALLEDVMEGRLENERAALTRAAKKYLKCLY